MCVSVYRVAERERESFICWVTPWILPTNKAGLGWGHEDSGRKSPFRCPLREAQVQGFWPYYTVSFPDTCTICLFICIALTKQTGTLTQYASVAGIDTSSILQHCSLSIYYILGTLSCVDLSWNILWATTNAKELQLFWSRIYSAGKTARKLARPHTAYHTQKGKIENQFETHVQNSDLSHN